MTRYKCLVCGELFEYKCMCAAHHLLTRHENFEIDGSDVKFKITSKEDVDLHINTYYQGYYLNNIPL